MRAASPGLELRGAVAAVALLSRLPLLARQEPAGADVARGAWAFPLVGAGLGVAVGALAVVGAQVLTPFAAAALAVCVGVLLTGALHLDGLADSADGLGGHSPQQALAIMRDHTVGSYGAAALSLDLILRSALLAALLARPGTIAALAAAGAVSRAAVLPVAALLPYARAEAGLGAALSGIRGRCLLGVTIAIALTLALVEESGLFVLATAAVVATFLAAFANRRFGGVTGDVLGATVELVELAALAVLAAVT